MGKFADSFTNLALSERDRWVLWVPVGFGVGIAIYFAIPSEPPLWLGPFLLVATASSGLIASKYHHSTTRTLVIVFSFILATLAIGFSAAKVRTIITSATVLQNPIGPLTINGRVMSIETFPTGIRITLDKPGISSLQPFQIPNQIRIRLRADQPDFMPGDWIRVRAKISPPSPPAAPGGFDFQRQAFFKGIGAVGFGLGRAEVIATASETGGQGIAFWIGKLRKDITRQIQTSLPGLHGGLAAALMTGEKRAVDEKVVQNLRDSGLAHLLSISGLHVGLVAVIVFAGLRFALALYPLIGLRYPIKKWASVAAILGAFGYAMIAGATLPTQRAFMMASLALIAVVFDRRGITMRALAWAASIVLLLQPESLLGPSFQMSFAAVMALVAVYEWITNRPDKLSPERYLLPNWLRMVGVYLVGIAITTFVAGLATAPYSAYHFNRFADYGVAANLIAVPITALWVMPWAVSAFALMPFGWESFALVPMSWGLELVIRVAETVSDWPGAVTLLPAIPVWGLMALSFGFVWLCLWRRHWRLWGGIPIALGISSLLFVEVPDLLVDAKGQIVALKNTRGDLQFSNLRQNRRMREMWLRMAGQEKSMGFKLNAGLVCDNSACLYKKQGQIISVVSEPEAMTEDCWAADAIVSLVPVRQYCPATIVIDKFDLWRYGTHALWIDGDKIIVKHADEGRGDRPWVMKKPKLKKARRQYFRKSPTSFP